MTSHPTLNGFCRVCWPRIEANLRVRCVLVNQVYEFLKQKKLLRISPDTGADHDAIVLLPAESLLDDLLCRFTSIDEADEAYCVVPGSSIFSAGDMIAA